MADEDPLTVHFKEAFGMMDKDRSGSLSAEELGKMFKMMDEELSDAQMQIIVHEMDKDGDGEIDLEEFMTYMDGMLGSGRDDELTTERIIELFNACDSDNGGDISAEELRKIYDGKVSTTELDEMIAEVDISGDGNLDLAEFTLLMLGIKKEAVEDVLDDDSSSPPSGSECWGDEADDRFEAPASQRHTGPRRTVISTRLQSRLQSLVNNENLFRAHASRCVSSRKTVFEDTSKSSRHFSWGDAANQTSRQDSEKDEASEDSEKDESSEDASEADGSQ